MKHIILILLVLLSIFAHGYIYGGANLSQVIPFIHHINNPFLYEGDAYIETFSSYPTFYCQLMANLSNILPLPILHFALYLVLKYLLLLGVFYLAMHLFSSRKTALVACFLFALSPFINSFSLLGEDPLMKRVLYQTTFVAPFAILAVLFFLRKRYFISFIILAFIYYLNGLIGNFLLILFIFGTYRAKKEIWYGWFVFLILWIPWIIWYLSLNYQPDPGFVAVIRSWHPGHYFSSSWSLYKWGRSAFFLAYFFIFFNLGFKNSEKSKSIKPFLLAIITMWGIAFVFGEIIPIRQLIALQFFRSDVLFISFGLIFAADYIRRCTDTGKLEYIALAGLLLLVFNETPRTFYILPLLLLLGSFYSANRIYLRISAIGFLSLCILDIFRYPVFLKYISIFSLFLIFILASNFKKPVMLRRKMSYLLPLLLVAAAFINIGKYIDVTPPDFSFRVVSQADSNEFIQGKDYLRLQSWIEENTPIDAKFITPPYRMGFRVFSKRSTFVERLDCAAMHWSKGFQKKWIKRMGELGYDSSMITPHLGEASPNNKIIYSSIGSERFLQLARKYKIDYVVVENEYVKKLDLPLVYKNDSFSIYSLLELDNPL